MSGGAIDQTVQESSGIWAWTERELNKLARTPPPVLWHYTDGTALIAIVETGSLWATQLSCLNDYSELSYAMRLVRRELEALHSLHRGNVAVTLMLDSAIDGLQERYSATNEWFVCCLSANEDDLSQWRAYGRGEGGYAIGLSSAVLGLLGARQYHFLAAVNYDTAAHLALAKVIAAEVVRSFTQSLAANPNRNSALAAWINQFLGAWRNSLVYLGPILKDAAFQAEHEWRIMHRLQPGDVKNLKFRQKQTLMSRHLPLHFRPPDGSNVLPIAKVLVGPSRNAHVSQVSVGDLLNAHSYGSGTPIAASKIPYQTP